MRLGLLIGRLNQCRHVEGIVRAAVARGHSVLLLCLVTDTGGKSYEAAEPARLPRRFHTMANPVRLTSLDDLAAALTSLHVDALVSVLPLPKAITSRVLSAWLQPTASNLFQVNPWRWDAVYGWSLGWRSMAERYRPLVAEGLRERFVPVGYAPAECLHWTDPAEVRATFGIAAPKITILLPYPFAITPWRYETHVRYGWPLLWPGHNDRALLRQVRAFADRSGTALVIKEREKNPVRGYARRVADHVIEGDEPGEPTLLRLLTLGDLLVHFGSTSVLDAASAGVRRWDVRIPGDVRLTGGWRSLRELGDGTGPFHFPPESYPYAERFLGGWPVPRSGEVIVGDLERKFGAMRGRAAA